MSTVDLEALERELERAGVASRRLRSALDVLDGSFTLWPGGGLAIEDVDPGPIFWTALDIIRRHLDPPVARPALRDRCAKAAFDAFWAEGTPYTDTERAMFGQVADAVLAEMLPSREAIRAAIAEAGISDDADTFVELDAAADAVLRLIAGGE